MGKWITKNGVHVWIEDKNLYNAISNYYSKEKYEDIYISSYEKDLITKEINYWCNIYTPKSKFKKNGVYSKAMFDYVYIFKIIDYNEYEILDKFPIDDVKGEKK